MRDAPTSRREVLQSALISGAIAMTTGPAAAATASDAPSRAPAPAPPPSEFDEITIASLQAGMASGKYTSRGLVEHYLQRLEAIDRRGPCLRQVIETNPDALAAADALDAERKAKGPRGPLHGVPVLVKDNIDTADRMTTTAGSLALEGWIPPRDAPLVDGLRKAGAVLLGKANLSEWANIRSSRSSSGWSARGKQCRNPYALDRTPSGSSSGSAAAVASNCCAAAVGTETDGSILSPSSCCSVVGIKPTVGLIPRTGVIPIAHSQDTAGPMARCVADAAALLGAMACADPADEATKAEDARREADYTTFLKKDGLKGARIGVLRAAGAGMRPVVQPLLETALAAMKSQGAEVIDPVEVATLGKFGDAEGTVLRHELKADLNAYLARLPERFPARSLAALIRFNEQHRDREMPYFGQETFERAESLGGLDTPAYQAALAKCRELSRQQGIDATMDKHRLDAIVFLTQGPPTLIDLVNGDYSSGGGNTSLAAMAGYPSLTVPAGYVYGLPVGLSFIGRAWSEAVLIRLAYAYEQATNVRRPPRFLPTAEIPGTAA
jgi:amidase